MRFDISTSTSKNEEFTEKYWKKELKINFFLGNNANNANKFF
jgi:hypothetical protein